MVFLGEKQQFCKFFQFRPIDCSKPLSFSVLRIRDVYPGYRIRIFSIPDPWSRVKTIPDPGCGFASKNLSIKFFYPKQLIMIWVVHIRFFCYRKHFAHITDKSIGIWPLAPPIQLPQPSNRRRASRLCRKEEFCVLEAWTPSTAEGWSPFSPLTPCPGCLFGEFQFSHHSFDAAPLYEEYLF